MSKGHISWIDGKIIYIGQVVPFQFSFRKDDKFLQWITESYLLRGFGSHSVSVYSFFIFFFEIAGKKNYVEIVLHHIDQYYQHLPVLLLKYL